MTKTKLEMTWTKMTRIMTTWTKKSGEGDDEY